MGQQVKLAPVLTTHYQRTRPVSGSPTATKARHRVAFATASQWVDQFAAAHATGKLQAELTRLDHYPLLVIDEAQWT